MVNSLLKSIDNAFESAAMFHKGRISASELIQSFGSESVLGVVSLLEKTAISRKKELSVLAELIQKGRRGIKSYF